VRGIHTHPNEAFLDQASLKDWLHYDPETGEFTWARAGHRGYKPVVNTKAGSITRGHRVIRINKRGYFAARLAWLYMTGEWPEMDMDHINRDGTDDKWHNLRDVSRSTNCFNKQQTDLRRTKGKPPRSRVLSNEINNYV
jgi:hypothetical protein